MTNSLQADIHTAIDASIKLWRNNLKGEIRQATLPAIPDDDPLIKSAVWFNFGVDAAKNLSLATSLMSRAALPIWALFKAQELYADYYHQPRMSSAQNMLAANYQTFKSQLLNSIDIAEEQFMGQTYARQVKGTLEQLFQNHPFEEGGDKVGPIRKLIRDSKVIEVDNGTLQKVVSRNLGLAANKLIDLYRGTKHAGRTKILYLSDNPRADMPHKLAVSSASCHIPGRGGESFVVPKHYRKIDTNNQADMAQLYSQAYIMDVKHLNYLWVEPCHDTTYARKTSLSQPTVKTILSTSYKSTIDALVRTYRAQYSGQTAPAI